MPAALLVVLPLLALAAPAAGQNVCPVEQGRIQDAIDACATRGGGVAYVPPGEYVSGPFWLKDNVELRLEAGAVIRLSRNASDWPAGAIALVNAKGVKNIAITGRGLLDGDAQWAYEPVKRVDVEIVEEQQNARRAGVEMKRYYRTGDVQKYLVVLQESQDIRIEGVTIRNAPLWNVRLQDCDRVWVRGVQVLSDLERGVNSDGIDIVSSSNVTISDSTIVTADDAIVVKTDRLDRSGARPVRPVENVLVNNCILGSSSTAMMIGTETHADIRHVVFSNIVVRDSNKVFGINVQDGATVSDVRVQNVTFETNRRHWNWWGSAEVMKVVLTKRTPDSKLGRIAHVTLDGMQGTARGTSLVAGHLDRSLEDFVVRNLHVRMLAENTPDKRATHALVFERVKGLTLDQVEVEWDRESREPKWESALVLRDIEGLDLRSFKGEAGRRGVEAVVTETTARSSSAPVGDPEAYALYASLLADHWLVRHAAAKTLVVQEETVTYDGCLPSKGPMETDWRPVLEDYKAANAAVHTVLGGDRLGRPYVVVPSARIRDAFKDSVQGAGWDAFHRRYPDARGYVQVSAVGFDAERRRAMVYLAHHCGGLCGGGRHYLLEKVDGTWRQVHPPGVEQCFWVS